MPLNDVDLVRRRFSVGLPTNLVDFIVYSYDEETFEETNFESVDDLIDLLEKQTDDNKSYWIEVINRSSVELPNKIQILCEYFDIHPLTIEDITTLAPYMKLDLFNDPVAVYLLMKIISWNGQQVEQQQISFYLKHSQNILITFQEKAIGIMTVFDNVRNRLRRQKTNDGEHSPPYLHNRLKQMNVDYLFYCLLDAIIDRYIIVFEEIAINIDRFDEKLMTDKQSLTLSTLHSIYHIKHDLMHLRILLYPLKEIIGRLNRTTAGEQYILFPRTDLLYRLDHKHRIARRQVKTRRKSRTSTSLVPTTMNMRNRCSKKYTKETLFFDEHIYIYFRDLNGHINQLIDSLDIQRESVSMVISLWLALNNNEIQEILKLLMLISALFMPCLLLVAMNSTNFQVQPQLHYEYDYYIVLILLGAILLGMITWYRVKRWI